jgi:hypothetical protein
VKWPCDAPVVSFAGARLCRGRPDFFGFWPKSGWQVKFEPDVDALSRGSVDRWDIAGNEVTATTIQP